ncbi:DNA-binding protein, partial [Clostridioides difficile]
KNGLYEFSYEYEIDEAIKAGFNALISFDDISKTYYSEDLFSPFASRLPDKKRKDINKILDKYDMSEYDT